ncbi:MAG: ribonuclease P protein component [Paramuribaculum sp.]|nr:ribonuclease P protein component [Paramuribaculum sp.]
MHKFSLNKRQRLCSQIAIDRLFLSSRQTEGESGHTVAYPWRAVWYRDDSREETGTKILISVPKKKLKHAVDRVKMRRRCREAYRFRQFSIQKDLKLDIAFIYIGNGLTDFTSSHDSIGKILNNINKKLLSSLDKDEK